MVRQHDAAGTHADRGRRTSDVPDQHRRRGAGDARHVVVFGQPVAGIPPALGMLRQIAHVHERLGGIAALADRREVEERVRDHGDTGNDDAIVMGTQAIRFHPVAWDAASRLAQQVERPALLQRTLIGRPCMDALQESGQVGIGVQSGAYRRGFDREAHLDVGGAELLAGEPRRLA